MAYRFLFAAALAVCAARVAPAETGFLNRTVTVQGIAYRYVVYVPGRRTNAGRSFFFCTARRKRGTMGWPQAASVSAALCGYIPTSTEP
ncbi:MAG TPA: hypothetical protein VMR62_07855 [Bryobacteraceae bacterium]|jgi:hypothetical protein|nr:hypothetical protein [Bryobacteraceae bacterium]